MQIRISGKNVDLGESLHTHMDAKMRQITDKYIGRSIDGHITLSRTARQFLCETTVHLSSGVFLHTEGSSMDPYGAFEDAAEKLAKRLRRYKRKLRDHHAREKGEVKGMYQAYTLAGRAEDSPVADTPDLDESPQYDDFPETESEDDSNAAADAAQNNNAHPLVIAEKNRNLMQMSVQDAVFQLEIIDDGAFVFKNASSGRMNVVYKRNDGHIGWIDPDFAEDRRK